jgi:hypothetical protein
MAELLVVGSKVKQYIQETHQLRCSAEVLEELSAKVQVMLDEAAGRCKEAKMGTVKGRHLSESEE